MNDEEVIKVSNVSKDFKLPHEKSSSLKSSAINFYKRKKSYELQKALKDISFEVKRGEFLGIVGRNGSGKSTLLKMLAGIYAPTKGDIEIKGKLTPFIELGVGFNPELTGRENVFLNGALLGFNRKEMQAMYQSIVSFAELEKFMDQKLKNYSSGMQVRLAFSIAIRAQPDILVLDEVLAVGDESFQRKCLNIFEEYKVKKQTVILVTHDMDTVRNFCDRAIVINKGEIIFSGSAGKAASRYSSLNLSSPKPEISESEAASPITVKLFDSKGNPTRLFTVGDKMKVQMRWPKEMGAKYAGVSIIKQTGEYIYGANTIDKKLKLQDHLEYNVDLDINNGRYFISASLSGNRPRDVLEILEHGPDFLVSKNPDDTEGGIARLNSSWKV